MDVVNLVAQDLRHLQVWNRSVRLENLAALRRRWRLARSGTLDSMRLTERLFPGQRNLLDLLAVCGEDEVARMGDCATPLFGQKLRCTEFQLAAMPAHATDAMEAESFEESFEELSRKITGMASLPKRKKHLRQALRAMERMLLVHIVNFPGEDADAPEPDDDVVGRNSLVSLTWTGMLWLRRAWAARERLSRHRDLALVHRELVAEEEEAGWADPYWVENVCSLESDAAERPAVRSRKAQRPITSIFDLGNRRS
jgi:hypothetical protein